MGNISCCSNNKGETFNMEDPGKKPYSRQNSKPYSDMDTVVNVALTNIENDIGIYIELRQREFADSCLEATDPDKVKCARQFDEVSVPGSCEYLHL